MTHEMIWYSISKLAAINVSKHNPPTTDIWTADFPYDVVYRGIAWKFLLAAMKYVKNQ